MFYCNIEIFQISKNCEKEAKNKQWVTKVYSLHLQLRGSGIMESKAPGRQKIQVFSNNK